MAIQFQTFEYNIIRSMATISIISLIIISVYQLNLILELLKRLTDDFEELDSRYQRWIGKNSSIAKLMWEPLRNGAHSMLERHEPAILMNVVIYSSVIALSIVGLVAAIRRHKIMLTIYAFALNLIYLTSFIYCARVPSFYCSIIVFVSIIVYLRSHHLWSKNSEDKIHLIQAKLSSSSDHNHHHHNHSNIV